MVYKEQKTCGEQHLVSRSIRVSEIESNCHVSMAVRESETLSAPLEERLARWESEEVKFCARKSDFRRLESLLARRHVSFSILQALSIRNGIPLGIHNRKRARRTVRDTRRREFAKKKRSIVERPQKREPI